VNSAASSVEVAPLQQDRQHWQQPSSSVLDEKCINLLVHAQLQLHQTVCFHDQRKPAGTLESRWHVDCLACMSATARRFGLGVELLCRCTAAALCSRPTVVSRTDSLGCRK
jgi:hypothetical protein